MVRPEGLARSARWVSQVPALCPFSRTSPCLPRDLIPLPVDYADVHTLLTASFPAKDAALCLVCGEHLSCGGNKGNCTRHARRCGAGIGVVFILDKSSLLLIRGAGASFLPAPYLDAFGEPFRKHHGTPLRLDQRRYDGAWCPRSS